EDQAAYTLAITARDNGIPQKSDTTSLEILVLDANDNAPRFLRDFYQGSVFEDAPPSTSVLQVSATDRDSGPNGRLLYTFQGGDDGDGDFYIEPTSGVIRTQRRLDRENVAVYSLRALAVDRGSPAPMSASVEIQVTVLDINDNPPVFERDELELFVSWSGHCGLQRFQVMGSGSAGATDQQLLAQIIKKTLPACFNCDFLCAGLFLTFVLRGEDRDEFVTILSFSFNSMVYLAVSLLNIFALHGSPPHLGVFETLILSNWARGREESEPGGTGDGTCRNNPEVEETVCWLSYSYRYGYRLSRCKLRAGTQDCCVFPARDNNKPPHLLRPVAVTDGIHSVTAVCTLRVTIITDDMLTNSITVRLENMSQEQFLSPLLGLFVEGLAAVLSTAKDDVFIFNIQNDTDVRSNILNVTFSALLPGGGRGRFFPSEDLQEHIYLNRTLLTTISAQRVLPFDDNICLREPCENYMKCVSVLRFDSSAPFISSTTVLFRPIHPITGLRCRCPPGFTGDYCETEIDLCYSSPCGAHGRCRSREGGYTCECLEDYTGEHCEVNVRSGRCANGVCKNGGTCVNLLIGGFHCVCPPGEYEKPYCEVTTRSFPPQSFVTFRGLRQRFHFTISLTFATQERNALLLYNGRFNEKHDFIALEIVDEQVQLTFSAGETTTTVAPQVPGGVSDGRWHSVQVQYYNKPHIGRLGLPHGPSGEKVAVVAVDDCDTAMAVRFGSYVGNYSCAAQGTQSGSKKSLDLTGPLLLGGVPNLPEDFPVHNRQFVGCMRNLSVDGKNMDMAGFIANNGTRAGCTAQRNFCDGVWCQNGGTCVNRWNTHLCVCPLRFGGKNCEQVMPHPQRFSGESIVSWDNLAVTISVPWYLGLMFRTRKADGVLMEATAGVSSQLLLQLPDNHVGLCIAGKGVSPSSRKLQPGESRVTDGEWHHLLIELKSAKEGKDIKYLAVMTLDYGMDQVSGHLCPLQNRSLGRVKTEWPLNVPRPAGDLVDLGEHLDPVFLLTLGSPEPVFYSPSLQSGLDLVHLCPRSCLAHPVSTLPSTVRDWEPATRAKDEGAGTHVCTHIYLLSPCTHIRTHVLSQRVEHKPVCRNTHTCLCEGRLFFDTSRGSPRWPFPSPLSACMDAGWNLSCLHTPGECSAGGWLDCFLCLWKPGPAEEVWLEPESSQEARRAGGVLAGRTGLNCPLPLFVVIYSGCPRAFEAGIWWPQTKFGQPAAVPCPKGSVGNAVRHCSGEKGWLPPELFNCTSSSFLDLKVMNEKLSRNETWLDGDSSVRLAKALRNATRHTGALFGNDIRTAYQLLARVLQHETRQEGFDLAATRDSGFHETGCGECDQCLLAPATRPAWEQIQRSEGGSAELLQGFEAYLSTMARSVRKTYLLPFVIVTPNMILAIDIFNKSNFTGARVPRFENVREEYPKELESSVVFPADFFTPPEKKKAHLGPSTEREAVSRQRRHPDESSQFAVALVIIYRTLGQLLPEHYDPDRRSLRLPGRPVINTAVVSAVVYSEGAVLPSPLERPVLVESILLETEERTKPTCVFWNHSIPLGGTGAWSAKGCELLSRNRTHVACQCSRVTSFAVLMDVSRREHGEVLPLKIVTYAALSLSLAALLVAFVLLALVRALRSNLHCIHKSLVAALFCSQLVFGVGIHQTENPFVCTVIAILLHYVHMSTFAWTFVEGLHVYRMLTEARNIDSGPMRFYYVVGWGVPAVITGLAVGLDPQGYGNPDFCWLSLRDTLIWSFAGPIGAVIIINTVIFVLSAKVSCQRKHHYYERKGVISLLRTAFLLLLLVSATWLLGLLAVNRDALVFHYLFAVFSCLQGLFVLLFHCVFNREVRKHLKGVLAGKKLHPDDSGATRATLLTAFSVCAPYTSDGIRIYNTYFWGGGGDTVHSITEGPQGPDYPQSPKPSGFLQTWPGPPGPEPSSPRLPTGRDSDSDSELSLDEQSSSYASSHSSDSEDEGVEAEDQWDPVTPQARTHGPAHSTPKVDPAANHIAADWPDGSDGEEPGKKPRLKVETKVSVELHQEERPAGPLPNPPVEQSPGILKNKVTYPPPLTEKTLKTRLREKLASGDQSAGSSPTSSLGSNDGGLRTPTDCDVTVKSPPPREPVREHLNGVAMHVRAGSAQANGADSE
uniref:Cadherin EGF LAG seven-pass G-type receptor 1 n=1 Tax=Loxodonta africana TaxID=9785 RepID=G3UIY0_LOXAF